MKYLAPALFAFFVCVVAFPTQARYADGMNSYAGYHVMHGGMDPSGLLLAAVDGTGSKRYLEGTPPTTVTLVNGERRRYTGVPGADRTDTLRWRSHVRNFFEDYRDGDAAYWHGPDSSHPRGAGREAWRIHRGVKQFICEKWCEDQSQPIDMIGYSRGAYIVMEVARDLEVNGCCCDNRTVKPVPVRFLGLYDPVDMAWGYGEAETVSSNVQHAQAIFPGTVEGQIKSRWYFNRAQEGAEDERTTNYNEVFVNGTHGGIGGAPWDGDHPSHLNERLDIRAAVRADQIMRNAAQAAGVTIRDIEDYGYSE